MASNALSHVYEDVSVDVPTLMTHPKAALLGVLTLLPGWENVSGVRPCTL
jgi:hypothetical protein